MDRAGSVTLADTVHTLSILQEINRRLSGAPPVPRRFIPSSSSGDLQLQAPPITPQTPSPIMASMPTGRSRNVPEFQPTIPGFKAFFDDIEECFRRAGVTADKEKIKWAKRYAGIHAEEWEQIPCLAPDDADPSFETFKTEVCACYPQLDENNIYTVRDLETLVACHSATDTMSREDYGNYLRPFRVRAGYLVKRGILSLRERNRLFIAGFPPTIRARIRNRLAIRKPDVLPVNGYDTADIEEAATFVINGAHDQEETPDVTRLSSTSRDTPADMMKEFAQGMTAVRELAQSLSVLASRGAVPSPAPAPNTLPPRPAVANADSNAPQRYAHNRCHFCGGDQHFIRQCPEAADFVRSGRAIYNDQRQLILPDGSFLPPNIPGRWLRDRFVNYWERQVIRVPENAANNISSTNFLECTSGYTFPLEANPSRSPPNPTSTKDDNLSEEAKLIDARIAELQLARAQALLRSGKKAERREEKQTPAWPPLPDKPTLPSSVLPRGVPTPDKFIQPPATAPADKLPLMTRSIVHPQRPSTNQIDLYLLSSVEETSPVYFAMDIELESEPPIEGSQSCHQPAIVKEHCASDIEAATPTHNLEVFSGSLWDSAICPDVTSVFEDEDPLDWYLETCFEPLVEDPESHRHNVEPSVDHAIREEFPVDTTPSTFEYSHNRDAEPGVTTQNALEAVVELLEDNDAVDPLECLQKSTFPTTDEPDSPPVEDPKSHFKFSSKLTTLEERILVSAPADFEKGHDFDVQLGVFDHSRRETVPIPGGDDTLGFKVANELEPPPVAFNGSALDVLISSLEDFLNGIEPVSSLEDNEETANQDPVPRLEPKSESPIDDSVHTPAAFDHGYGSSLSILASPPDSPSHDPIDNQVLLVRFPSSSSLPAVRQSDSSEFETTPEPLFHSRMDQLEPLEEDSEGNHDIAAAFEPRSPPLSLTPFPPQHTQSYSVPSVLFCTSSSSTSPPSFISFPTRTSSRSSCILFYFHVIVPFFIILLHYILQPFNASDSSASVIPTHFGPSPTSLFSYSLPLRLSIGGFIANPFVLALVFFAISPRPPSLFPTLQVFATPPRTFSFHLEPFFGSRINEPTTPGAHIKDREAREVRKDVAVTKARDDSGPTSWCAQSTLRRPREPSELPRDGRVVVEERSSTSNGHFSTISPPLLQYDSTTPTVSSNPSISSPSPFEFGVTTFEISGPVLKSGCHPVEEAGVLEAEIDPGPAVMHSLDVVFHDVIPVAHRVLAEDLEEVNDRTNTSRSQPIGTSSLASQRLFKRSRPRVPLPRQDHATGKASVFGFHASRLLFPLVSQPGMVGI